MAGSDALPTLFDLSAHEKPKGKAKEAKPKKEFWETPLEQSKIKTEIVANYFSTWASIVGSSAQQLGYIDLFCGRGTYEDGSPSTPIRVMEKILTSKDWATRTTTFFNDVEPDHIEQLRTKMASLPRIDSLSTAPEFGCTAVGPDIIEAVKRLTFDQATPSLIFVDPFGYKGLTLDLIRSAISNWGCDCIFFFNYLRINPAAENPAFREHMVSLFGPQRFGELEAQLEGLRTPHEREDAILQAVYDALASVGGQYTITLKFKKDKGKRPSHFLVLTSKHKKAYMVMKDIMAKHCEVTDQGVPLFEYNRVTVQSTQALIAGKTLEDLERMLIADYKGRECTVGRIYEDHSIGRPFQDRHYKQVLKKLEGEGRLIADPPAAKRPRDTMGDKTFVRFL